MSFYLLLFELRAVEELSTGASLEAPFWPWAEVEVALLLLLSSCSLARDLGGWSLTPLSGSLSSLFVWWLFPPPSPSPSSCPGPRVLLAMLCFEELELALVSSSDASCTEVTRKRIVWNQHHRYPHCKYCKHSQSKKYICYRREILEKERFREKLRTFKLDKPGIRAKIGQNKAIFSWISLKLETSTAW